MPGQSKNSDDRRNAAVWPLFLRIKLLLSALASLRMMSTVVGFIWLRAMLTECRRQADGTSDCSREQCRPGVAEGGELDLRQTGDLMRFTIAVNFCGLPAISVPVGHSAQGTTGGVEAGHAVSAGLSHAVLPALLTTPQRGCVY